MPVNQAIQILCHIMLYGGVGLLSLWLTQRIANAFFICVKHEPTHPEKVTRFFQFVRVWLQDMYDFYFIHLLSPEKAMDDDLIMRVRLIAFMCLGAIFYQYYETSLALIYIPLVWFVVPFSFVDSMHRLLPVFIILKILIVGLVLSYFGVTVSLLDAIRGMIVSTGFLGILNAVYSWLRNQTGIASGDVIYIAMCGVWFGLEGVVFIFLFSSFISVLATVANMANRRQPFLQTTIPFGPFITAGLIIYIIFKKNFNDILGF